MRRNASIVFIGLLFCVTVPGCSVGEPSRYAAKGTVTIEGTPAPLVVVRFHSTDSGTPGGGAAATDSSGQFTLGEDGKDTGLPSGEYKVTFSQTLVRGKPTLGGSGGKKNEKLKGETEAVAEEYRDPAKTPVAATIRSGTNTFAFDVKKGAK
jgi:hypothetical protein